MTPLNMIDRHHLTPKCRVRRGKLRMSLTIRLKRVRHNEWHRVFGDMTLDEIIDLLQRVRRFKYRSLPF